MAPPKRRSRWFAWWYMSIGAGFALLAINRMLHHDYGALVWLRWAIAAGFVLLGWLELRVLGR